MEKENPVLKTNKNLSIQNLDVIFNSANEAIENQNNAKRLYEESIKSCEKKLQKLEEDEKQKDLFIGKLREKVHQLDEEIKEGTVLKFGLKRTTSLIS